MRISSRASKLAPGGNQATRMLDQNLISLVSALTALIASIVGPMVTLYATRTQVRANVRSVNRQRWIDDFRNAVANLCSEIALVAQERSKVLRGGQFVIGTNERVLQTYGKLIFTTNKIRLLVNPADESHDELMQVLDSLFEHLRNSPDDKLQMVGQEIAGRIVAMSVAIIRREWRLIQRGR